MAPPMSQTIPQKKLLKDNYKRIQPVITSDISTFQADEANLTALSRAADHYLNHCGGKERLKKLAQQLVNA